MSTDNPHDNSCNDRSTDAERLVESASTLDLRCAIADRCAISGYRARVENSASKSHAAIYFRRDSLDDVACELGLDPEEYSRKAQLVKAMRRAAGGDGRDNQRFDFRDLARIAESLGISQVRHVDPHDLDAGEAGTIENQPGGVWGDWRGA